VTCSQPGRLSQLLGELRKKLVPISYRVGIDGTGKSTAPLRKRTAGLMGKDQNKALLCPRVPFWLQAGPARPS